MKQVIVKRTRKQFTGSWVLLILLSFFMILPGFLYFLVSQGTVEYEARE